jgi:APA family basic amino acid/polyamine antiporter
MTHSVLEEKDSVGLIRQLGMFDSIMMMVGIVIGSGIFITTGIMAQTIPSASLILLAWVVGGILTLAGALSFAELGASMPEAGGQYIYLREAYGHLVGFLFGWILFLVSMGGSIAALAVGFAEFLGYFFPSLSNQKFILTSAINIFGHNYPISLSMGQIVAVVVILVLSTFNYIGVGYGKTIQNVATAIKIGTILVFVILGFTIGKTISIDFTVNPTGVSFNQLLIGFGVAVVAVTWAFDGWNNITYIAGEIKNPKRNLPFSLFMGTLIITVLYVLMNYVYLLALPINEMAGVLRIAEKSSAALFGTATAGLISAAALISTFGALNGAIFVGPRVYYAMAKDKIFFKKVAEVHPRFHTPGFAIIIQAVWSCVLTLTGTYEQLFTYVVFVSLIFWITATASIFALRKKRPDLPRPYKTWGYPVVPIVFILTTFGILINTLIAKPIESFAGLGITVLGIPVYYYWRRKSI